jgi:hypothetical protein
MTALPNGAIVATRPVRYPVLNDLVGMSSRNDTKATYRKIVFQDSSTRPAELITRDFPSVTLLRYPSLGRLKLRADSYSWAFWRTPTHATAVCLQPICIPCILILFSKRKGCDAFSSPMISLHLLQLYAVGCCFVSIFKPIPLASDCLRHHCRVRLRRQDPPIVLQGCWPMANILMPIPH